MSSEVQTLISVCLITSLVLHSRGVIVWLHCLCPELKLPKVLALGCWINHRYFLRTTANHLWVRLTLPPLIIQIERSKAFFCGLSVPLALINGAPLMENYIGTVTLKRGKRRNGCTWMKELSLCSALLLMSCSGTEGISSGLAWVLSLCQCMTDCCFCVTAHSF